MNDTAIDSESARAPTPEGAFPAMAPRALAQLAVAVLLVVFTVETVQIALVKSYSLDELTYAHASWCIAQGQVPFRDFFFHHTPLLLQLGALPFLWLGDDPNHVHYLRLLMLPFLALAGWAAWRLNALAATEAGEVLPGWSAVLAPILMLSTFVFATMATEFRPDPVAFAFCLAAVAVLGGAKGSPALRAWLAGLLVGAAVWTSEKVVIYGVVFALAWGLDVTLHRRRGLPRLLLRPVWFCVGVFTAALAAVLYLSWTECWPAFFQWGVRWPLVHQKYYPGFSWWTYFEPFLLRSWWLLPLAAVGVVGALRRLRRAESPPTCQPDFLLLALLVTTFVSYAMQKSAYPYSLIPFAGLLAIFAARGLVAALDFAVHQRRQGRAWALPVLLAVSLATAVALFFAWGRLEVRQLGDNAYQHEVFHLIETLTDPEDPVYDNTGGYVARPHVSFFYFTDATVRRLLPQMLAQEMPAAIWRSGCTAFLMDTRFGHLPDPLKAFVIQNFQPYNGDLFLWGRRYQPRQFLDALFPAVRTGAYFVEPAAVLDGGELLIDGQAVTQAVFPLEAGEHRIEYRGPAKEFHLLWLPRDGQPWRPQRGLPPRFSHLF